MNKGGAEVRSRGMLIGNATLRTNNARRETRQRA